VRKRQLSKTHHPVRTIALLAFFLIVGWSNVALAQSGDEDEQHRFNYCFATRLGSGVYDISGRIIQVYRVPLSYGIRDFEGRKYGVNFKAPVTLGFFDFSDSDVEDSDLPENIGTAAIVPAIEIPVRLKPNWYLAPMAGLGVGKDFAGGDLTYIYQVALRSVASFPRKKYGYTLWNELAYLGHTVPGEEPNEDVALFGSGLDLRRPLKYSFRGHDTDFGLFVANYMYGEPTEYFLSDDDSFEVKTQYEIGFTVGTPTPLKIWRLPIPRVGLSYRFGDGVSAIRLVLGNPF
jgi:hypothetical protein